MRFALGVAVLVVVSSGSAFGKPLPKGMKVTLKDDKLYVELGGVTVPAMDAEAAEANVISDLRGAELSDDGKQIVVHAGNCRSMGEDDDGIEIPLVEIEARVENFLGMQLHRKKNYAGAIPHFAAAAQKAPATAMYATNLLSAQAMATKLDDADKTIATYAPAHVPWFAWRIAVDPELAKLRGRPSTKVTSSAKPSTLSWKKLGGAVAISPLGFAAVAEWSMFGGPGTSADDELAIYDLKTNELVLRLPVTAANTRGANALLAALGFEARSTTELAGTDDDKFVSADKQVTLTFDKDRATITRGKSSTVVPDADLPKKARLAGNLLVLTYRENGFAGCSGDAQRSYTKLYPLK